MESSNKFHLLKEELTAFRLEKIRKKEKDVSEKNIYWVHSKNSDSIRMIIDEFIDDFTELQKESEHNRKRWENFPISSNDLYKYTFFVLSSIALHRTKELNYESKDLAPLSPQCSVPLMNEPKINSTLQNQLIIDQILSQNNFPKEKAENDLENSICQKRNLTDFDYSHRFRTKHLYPNKFLIESIQTFFGSWRILQSCMIYDSFTQEFHRKLTLFLGNNDLLSSSSLKGHLKKAKESVFDDMIQFLLFLSCSPILKTRTNSNQTSNIYPFNNYSWLEMNWGEDAAIPSLSNIINTLNHIQYIPFIIHTNNRDWLIPFEFWIHLIAFSYLWKNCFYLPNYFKKYLATNTFSSLTSQWFLSNLSSSSNFQKISFSNFYSSQKHSSE